jgi:hypothetical protein
MRRRGVRILTVTGVGVAVVATAGALAVSASASPSRTAAPSRAATPRQGYPSYQVKQVLYGADLRHKNSHTGKNEALSQPAAITQSGGTAYAAFDNGVGTQGQASASGNLDSTIVQFAPGGSVSGQWDVAGQVAGLGANPDTGEIVATVNAAGHSSLYTIDGGSITHYTYSKALPSKGGTAGVAFYDNQLLVTASAPGTSGAAAPQASYPAVYSVTLNPGSGTATVSAYYYDESPASVANGGPPGSGLGKPVTLGLTDPVTATVVPSKSPRWRGAFVLNSEADRQLIYSTVPGSLWTLKLAQPLADTTFATAWRGELLATDPSANTVDEIGWDLFWPGTEFVSVVPCAAFHITKGVGPACRPAYLGRLSMLTGQIIPVELGGAALHPGRLVFVPSS